MHTTCPNGRTQSDTHTLAPAAERRARMPPPRRLQPLSGAAAVQRGTRESKEGVGGTRNPPIPPWPPEAATRLLSQPKAAQERAAKAARQRQNTKQHPKPCNSGRAPRKNAPPCRLHPPSGAAAVQRGEKRIQGGSRGNSQSPYPSLAAGGCHAAAAAAKIGARTRRESRKTTAERKAPHPLICNKAERRARTQRSAASIPLAERRRFKG